MHCRSVQYEHVRIGRDTGLVLSCRNLKSYICFKANTILFYYIRLNAVVMFKLPVIMLDMMRGRMTSFSIRIRISPGKPKYCLWRGEREAYSLTTTPKLIPERLGEKTEPAHEDCLKDLSQKSCVYSCGRRIDGCNATSL